MKWLLIERLMTHKHPFRRNARPFTDGIFHNWSYARQSRYALDGRRYIRAAIIIQQDLLKLFESVEPSVDNFNCYSLRIHELLVRTCIEIEANFKAILSENGYAKAGRWNINDYKKIEATHLLSSYRAKVPDFSDLDYSFQPFENWTTSGYPKWHNAYNEAKHDRHKRFREANFGALLNATSGLFVVLASQFICNDLSPSPDALVLGHMSDGYKRVAGDLFRVKFPDNWPANERYDFSAADVKDDDSFFQKLNYA